MSERPDAGASVLDDVFADLRRRLSRFEDDFRATSDPLAANRRPAPERPRPPDDTTTYLLLGKGTEHYPAGQMFASVRRGKRYVSYYLFSLYMEPAQVDDLSDRLRSRMQGKTCFNFKVVDDELFAELERLTQRGRDLYAARGLLYPDR